MKKFYFLAVAAVIALSSSATNYTFSADRNVNGLASPSVTNSSEASAFKATDNLSLLTSSEVAVKADTDDETTWTSLGTGTWVEGPLDAYSDIKSGVTHELEIFQSDSNPNIYRMVPYGEGSELATLLSRTNTNYFYIDVTTADKVLGYGDYNTNHHVAFFNSFLVSQIVPESNFNGEGYGVYDATARTVSFPAKSFAISISGSWYTTNNDGKFMIYLPGADVKDYSFSSQADLCSDDNVINFSVSAGADIADIKAVIMDGNYTAAENVLAYAAANGQSINRDKNYTFTDEEAGVYSIIIAALDADGNVKDGATHWVQIIDDNDDDWEELGAGVYTDPILYDATYLNATKDYDVTVERSISNPSRFRFKSPFGEIFTSYNISHSGHEHYIYIDMTDPEAVVVELSLTGLAVNYGQIRIWSVNGRYSGNTADELKEYGYGISTYDDATNTITFPAKSLFYQEPEYANGSWYAAQYEGKLVLPEFSTGPGLGAIETIEADAAGETEYYNLQGIRIAEPEQGIFIIRQGGKTAKILK